MSKADKLYKEAKENLIFQNDLKIHEPKNYKPKIFFDEKDKAIYSSIYMGYLIGKGIYNENDYK